MSTTNLAQHEQYLKSLEHSLKEIGNQHCKMQNSLFELHAQTRDHINQSWADILNLFVVIDQLRSMHLKFETEGS